MAIKTFFPWFRRDWSLAQDWRKVLRFMSTQINIVGASVVGFMMWAGWAEVTVFGTLGAWVSLAAIGAIIEQPELHDE